jgi:hypothetical protein
MVRSLAPDPGAVCEHVWTPAIASAMVSDRTRAAWLQGCADVAQLVEHHLAKVRVAGSNPVVRSERVSPNPNGEHVSWWSGREARQRTANPCTRVQIPSPPRAIGQVRGASNTVADRPPAVCLSPRDPRLLYRQRLSSLCLDTRYNARRLGSTRVSRDSRDTARCGAASGTSMVSPWPRLSPLSMIRASVPRGLMRMWRRYVSAVNRMEDYRLGCPGGTADLWPGSTPVPASGDWRSGSALP